VRAAIEKCQVKDLMSKCWTCGSASPPRAASISPALRCISKDYEERGNLGLSSSPALSSFLPLGVSQLNVLVSFLSLWQNTCLHNFRDFGPWLVISLGLWWGGLHDGLKLITSSQPGSREREREKWA
jgi:hypothetical protein